MSDLQHNAPDELADSPGSESDVDHDQPYRFGLQPRSSHPFPPAPLQRGFTTREYARLLIFRGRIRDSRDCRGGQAA